MMNHRTQSPNAAKNSRKRILRAICFVGVFFALYQLWGLSQTDDRASYTRLMMHEMYSAGTIDLAYIGASPVYRGIDPAISDEMLNRNTFNLSSSAQTIVDSYYLLKETVKTHPDSIKTVIFHLSFTGMNDEESQRASVILIRYFKPSLNRQLFAYTAFGDLFYSTPVSMHAYGYDTEQANFLANLRLKLTDPLYKNYDASYAETKYERYAGKGYVANTYAVEKGTMEVPDLPIGIVPGGRAETYARKLIEFCQQKGIRVIVITVPHSEERLLAQGESYDAAHDYIAGIAADYGVPYWDFNLADAAYLPGDDSCFKDAQHMNQTGAERFTKLLCRVLLDYENGLDVSGYFCSSAGQRIAEIDGIRAVTLRAGAVRQDGSVEIQAAALAGPEMETEYRFELMRGKEVIDATEYGPGQSYACPAFYDDLTIVCFARRKGADVAYDARKSVAVSDLLQEGAQ